MLGLGGLFCYNLEMQTKTIEKYFFFILLLGTSIFTFMIFRPFWIVLVLGASFAIVLYPAYLRLNKIFHTNWLSSRQKVFDPEWDTLPRIKIFGKPILIDEIGTTAANYKEKYSFDQSKQSYENDT
jgi:hypothetical protein